MNKKTLSMNKYKISSRIMLKKILVIVVLLSLLMPISAIAVPNQEPIDKIVFIHYKKAKEKTFPASTDQASYYKLIGIKWKKLPVTYYVNPANSKPDITGVVGEVGLAFEEWDMRTRTELFNLPIRDDSKVAGSLDNANVVSWEPLNDDRIIAVTYIWYYRFTKEIVETDIIMNSQQPWGIDPDGEGLTPLVGAYDVRNIATHEAGHVCGLDDLYYYKASELTMYGYSSLGEVKKDSLGKGDILGVQKLYGA